MKNMKQVSFGKFTVQLFLSSVFGVFVCACLDFWLGLEGDNLWSQLFMMFGYVFLYSLFPYYINRQTTTGRSSATKSIIRKKWNTL